MYGRSRDNKGWIRPECPRCKVAIDYNLVRQLLGDKFEAFDQAMVRMMLTAQSSSVIVCPGTNCPMSYFKAPTRKEKARSAAGHAACRSFTCQCNTSMCTLCGERWQAEHETRTCVQFAQWKVSACNVFVCASSNRVAYSRM